MKDLIAFVVLIAVFIMAVPFGARIANDCRSTKKGVVACVSGEWFDAMAEAKR